MPVYCFRCPQCGHVEEHVRTIERRNDPCPCPNTHAHGAQLAQMERDIFSENGQWSPNIDYDKPVFSESLGVHPSQVAKAQAKHPWMKYQSDGTLRIDSPAEYARVRKELGFVDRRPR
jgi:putative FmdB family regulatory protein